MSMVGQPTSAWRDAPAFGFQHAFNNPLHAQSPSRKRHAEEAPPMFESPDKRRRPNLAHGFSGLSLSTDGLQPMPPVDTTDVDDDDLAPRSSINDVSVEEVDTPSSPSSVSTVDSDATFRDQARRHIRRKRQTLQPDSIEQPQDGPVGADIEVQDVTNRPRKRRDHDGSEDMRSKRRRTDEMDLDEDMEEIPRRKSRNRTQWHEPEKDRIVITSLGSPDSSRETSRESSPSHSRHLEQPGANGFTLNASLLTHLLNAQRDGPNTIPQPQRKDLVLYRPLGIDPGRTWHDDVVREWDGQPMVDTGRFEEIDEDEPLEQAYEDDAMAMDIE